MTSHHREMLRAYYRGSVEYFDALDRHFHENRERYIGLLPARYLSGGDVLEAGCGSGAMGHWLAQHWGARVVGIDLSLYALGKARVRCSPHVVQGDLERLPFRPASFDSVLLFHVLEHVVAPEALFAELHAVLREGGHIVVISPNLLLSSRVPWLLRLRELADAVRPSSRFRTIEPQTDGIACGDRDAALVTNPLKVARCLRAAGFELVQSSWIRCRFVARK